MLKYVLGTPDRFRILFSYSQKISPQHTARIYGQSIRKIDNQSESCTNIRNKIYPLSEAMEIL